MASSCARRVALVRNRGDRVAQYWIIQLTDFPIRHIECEQNIVCIWTRSEVFSDTLTILSSKLRTVACPLCVKQ